MLKYILPILLLINVALSCEKTAPPLTDLAPDVTGNYLSDTDSTKLVVSMMGMNLLKFSFSLTDSNGVQTWVFDNVVLQNNLIFQQPEHDNGLIWTNYTGEVFPFRSTCNGIFERNRVHFQSLWIFFEGRK